MANAHRTERESFPPKWLLVVAILCILVGVIWTGIRITSAEAQLQHELRDKASLGQQVDHAFCKADPATLTAPQRQTCEQAGEKAAQPTEPPAPFDPPQDGQDGVDGVDGKPGEKGDKGDKGDPGDPGTDGEPGADATAPPAPQDGQDGAPGTPGQDGAPGAPGEPGAAGAPGADGRGVADMQCSIQPDGNGVWVVTYTDGSTDPDAGPCYTAPPSQRPLLP